MDGAPVLVTEPIRFTDLGDHLQEVVISGQIVIDVRMPWRYVTANYLALGEALRERQRRVARGEVVALRDPGDHDAAAGG